MWSTALARLSACSQSPLGAGVRLAPGMPVRIGELWDGTEACSAPLSSRFEQRLSLGDDGVAG